MRVSHDTKRLLGTGSMVLILILFLARSLPFPFLGLHSTAISRTSDGPNRRAPTLIFSGNVSFTGRTGTFNLTLIQSHSYMWKFNVTTGSLRINLTDPKTGSMFWTVGPRSSGQWHLSGTGFVSFNWTAPASTPYSLVLENLNFSSFLLLSSWRQGGTTPYFACDIHVWDLDTPATPPIFFR